jgi:hypothetical protein
MLLVGHPRQDASGVVDNSSRNTPEHFLAILQKEHTATCNLLLQQDKFAKNLEEKLAKKDQDALIKTGKMKTKHLEEKKRIRNDTASDKDNHMKRIKRINEEHRAGINELKSQIRDFKAVKMTLTSTEISLANTK